MGECLCPCFANTISSDIVQSVCRKHSAVSVAENLWWRRLVLLPSKLDTGRMCGSPTVTGRKIKCQSLKQDSMIRALWAFCVNLPWGSKINFHFQAKSRLHWDPCNGRACAWRAVRWGFHLWGFSDAHVNYSYLGHLSLWNSLLSPNNISVLLLLLSLDTEYEAMSHCSLYNQ